MRNTELFKKYIAGLRKLETIEIALGKLGVDIMSLTDIYLDVYTPVLNMAFNAEQLEQIDWWLYDSPKGINGNPEKAVLWDSDGEEIDIRTEEKFYEYLQTVKEKPNA